MNTSNSITLVVAHPVPSLNTLFAMSHWGRKRERDKTQAALLSALSATATDSSTRTTSAQNTLSMACATLASYLATRKRTSITNARAKSKSPPKPKNEPSSPSP